jgi:hypothetical protein
MFQMDDHVGAVPDAGGHVATAPPELLPPELPLPDPPRREPPLLELDPDPPLPEPELPPKDIPLLLELEPSPPLLDVLPTAIPPPLELLPKAIPPLPELEPPLPKPPIPEGPIWVPLPDPELADRTSPASPVCAKSGLVPAHSGLSTPPHAASNATLATTAMTRPFNTLKRIGCFSGAPKA